MVNVSGGKEIAEFASSGGKTKGILSLDEVFPRQGFTKVGGQIKATKQGPRRDERRSAGFVERHWSPDGHPSKRAPGCSRRQASELLAGSGPHNDPRAICRIPPPMEPILHTPMIADQL